MNEPFVSLIPEVTRDDASCLMNWLSEEPVTRFLSDDQSVSVEIQRMLERVQAPSFTHLFARQGRFYMVRDREEVAVGFLRLIPGEAGCEVVIVIGSMADWGKGLGLATIRSALKIAFLEMRERKVIAKIQQGNERSLRAFLGCGFQQEEATPSTHILSLSIRDYFTRLRAGEMAPMSEVHVTNLDKDRIEDILYSGDPLADLEHEIERAVIVEPLAVAAEIVTMNSMVSLRLDDELAEVSLVYPHHADHRFSKVSVSSEVGTAILGYREGDGFDWRVDGRVRRLTIGKVLYQPEAWGDLHL